MRLISSILVFFICIGCNSCWDGSLSVEKNLRSVKKEHEKKINETKKIKEQEDLVRYADAYGALANFNEADFLFTYQYQELLDENDRVIIDEFDIIDIVRLDTNYRLLVQKSSPVDFHFNLVCSEAHLKKIAQAIFKEENRRNSVSRMYLIFEIESLKKVSFEAGCGGEYSEDSGMDTYLVFNSVTDFYCVGRLIDFQESK
jgi:DNA polymerase II large subunit